MIQAYEIEHEPAGSAQPLLDLSRTEVAAAQGGQEIVRRLEAEVPRSALRLGDDPAAKAQGRLLFASGATNIPARQIANVRLKVRKAGKQLVRTSTRRRIRGVMKIRNSTGAVSSTRIRIKLPLPRVP